MSKQALSLALIAGISVSFGCAGRKSQGSSDPAKQVEVDAQYRESWNELLGARDAGSDQIDHFAEQILAQKPPLELQVATLQIQAERAYEQGDDEQVIELLDDAEARRTSANSEEIGVRPGLVQGVQRLRAFALVRGGDAARGLASIETLHGRGLLTEVEHWGSRAVAHDRLGALADAAIAYLEWRARLENDAADAAYAEDRFTALAARLDKEELRTLATTAVAPGVSDCLLARSGATRDELSPKAPKWVDNCLQLPARIGVLLPRTGRYAVLADRHFAAATAAIRVLAREREVAVLWQDSGSSPGEARAGVQGLINEGVQVIIGPVGTQNIRAASEVAGADLTLVVPGAGVSDAIGVAPSLKDRIASLLDLGRQRRLPPVFVAPNNAYGRRVATVLASLQAERGLGDHEIVLYSPDTTSFKPTLEPLMGKMRKGALLVVADAMNRVELVLRQLRRDGIEASESSLRGAVVASTGEGFGRARVDANRAVFEGVVFAPAAWPSESSARFEEEFREQQDAEPDEQALLLWRAFDRVWHSGESIDAPQVGRVQVRDGQIVEATP